MPLLELRQVRQAQRFVFHRVDLAEIMQKRFYIVVPFDPSMEAQKSFVDRLGAIFTPMVTFRLTDERFNKNRTALMLRVNNIIAGLQGMSLSAVMLDTQSLIELYYTVYNPELFETQRMTDVGKLQLEG